ncbi:response regulator [Bradyrhizobium stylosanthis]|uniref:Response regulator receiver domain-containing protein n=1 Tax=Bradyrhizobium stylosanthis TaxID=1803665 RepID=A0A560E2K4_9BRAD|nr:response regulator [Bradyrhizobium stylosanthis]TWB03606.1 response regulator receiver domain-containing protein [Bradyrhizobium stylosanthis]
MGVAVILVEDDALIRMMIVEMLEELGHRVVAEAGNVTHGRSLACSADFEVALLDINVGGENILPVAQSVAARGLPILFMSGYKADGLPDGFSKSPLLTKPFEVTKLREAMETLVAKVN